MRKLFDGMVSRSALLILVGLALGLTAPGCDSSAPKDKAKAEMPPQNVDAQKNMEDFMKNQGKSGS